MFESRPNDSNMEDTGIESKQRVAARFARLKKAFADPITEAHIEFFSAALPLFTSYNLFLQRSDPLAHLVYPMTKSLIEKIGKGFLKLDVVQNITIETLEDEENYLPLSEVHIGLKPITILADLLEGIDGEPISKTQHEKFLKACQGFYKSSLGYAMKKMDVNNEFWEHAMWINFFDRKEAKWSDVTYFVTKYKQLLNFTESEFMLLYEEFFDYKALFIQELPLKDAIMEGKTTTEEDEVQYRMDVIWHQIQEMKSPAGDNFRFKLLFRVAVLVLITPHSNAGIERVYSLVNKNKGEGSDRNRMDIGGTLSSILAVKLGRPESTCACHSFNPSQNLIESAKRATRTYNDEHNNKQSSSNA